MKIEIKKVGMRNIKTAISVSISILIASALKMEYPFYTAIASIITMQGSVEASFLVGRNRMIGTLVGAFVGFICASIKPGDALVAGAGIILVIFVCNLVNRKESSSIAGVVFCAIMLNLKGGNALFYSINRILDTFVGIAVAVIVNYFLVPPKKVQEK
jgi:uncharacterized membrane protein YgaE (UPF0421/DUF939 family)